METGFPCRKSIAGNGNEDCALLLNVVLEVSAWSWGARPGDLLLLVSVSFEALLGSAACPFGKTLGVVGAMFCKVKESLASHVWLSTVATGFLLTPTLYTPTCCCWDSLEATRPLLWAPQR